MPKTLDQIEKEKLFKQTVALRNKLNAGINKENQIRRSNYDPRLPKFNLSDEEIKANIEARYETYKRCNQFLNENGKVEKDNKTHIARNGETNKKENFREPFFLNSNNAFKAYNDSEFKDVVKQVNTPAKTRDFKMNLISSHINGKHFDALGASLSPDASLEFVKNNKKEVFIGADFSNICKDSKENKIDFDVSKDLNNEIDNNKKFLEDPYKAILSQINFNANPASFLFAKDSDITDKKAEAFKFGVDSISFGEADNTEELENLFDLKQAASDIDNITTEKKIEYSNSANELVNPQNNEEHPLDNAKTLVMNEKDKYSLDAYKDRINDPKRSVTLSSDEFDKVQQQEMGKNYKVPESAANYFNYYMDASKKEKDGDIEFDKKGKMDDNRDFMREAIKDEYELNNMSRATKFFSRFTNPDEDKKNASYLKTKVAQNKKYFEDNNMSDLYNNAYQTYSSEKDNQKKQKQEDADTKQKENAQQTPASRLAKLLKTPASKGKSVMEVGDPNFDRAEAAEIKRKMTKIHNKSGFLTRQLSRLIPDFLLDFGPFRWIMKKLVPFGIGRSLLRAADTRREIQKFNRKMDRGFIDNPLGKFNNDPNLSPQEKAVADYKANYKAILGDYYKTNGAGRFGSNFVPKSWTDTGKCKLDIQNNDAMLQEILGPLSSKDLDGMKKEMMDEFFRERNENKNQNMQNEKQLDNDALDKALGIDKENQNEMNNELDKEKDLNNQPELQENKNVNEGEKLENSNNNLENSQILKDSKENLNINNNLENSQILKDSNENSNINNENKQPKIMNIVNHENDPDDLFNSNDSRFLNDSNLDLSKSNNLNEMKENNIGGNNNIHKQPMILDGINFKFSSGEYLTENDRSEGLVNSKQNNKQNNFRDFNRDNQM